MPTQIPFPTKAKKPPKGTSEVPQVPTESAPKDSQPKQSTFLGSFPVPSRNKETKPETTPAIEEVPDVSPEVETIPDQTPELETVPEQTPELESVPEASPAKAEMPSALNMENVVTVGGKQIEIKPTKLKYFRNKTAAAYGYIKAVPMTEFLLYDKGVFDKNKDADQLLFDWLVAVFDDADFVTAHYDEITADDVEKLVEIFGRLNHIDQKEEAARKNREAQGNR